MGDQRFAWQSNGSNTSSRAKKGGKSKTFAVATAKAMKSTAQLFEILKEGNIPLVGIIGCSLKAVAGMLQPEITNEELANYLENSLSKIASDMKNFEEDVSKVKQIAIELRYLEGIEKVDAAYKTFIKGAENISQTLTDLRNFMFELQTTAEHSLSPKKINSYFNEIKVSKDFNFKTFQQSFAYVIATKAKFLLLCVCYYMHTGVADRIGEEFERFNAEFNEIFYYYQTTLSAKWIGESIRDVSSENRNIVGIALKPGSSVERVESEFQKFNAANCFKLEIRNYTSFDLISNHDVHISTRHVSNHTTDIKPGEWELIAGRKSSASLNGVEGVFSWNIAGTEKFVSVMFGIPYSLLYYYNNGNRLAIGIHGKSDLTAEEKLKRMYDGIEKNFKGTVFNEDTEPIKSSDDDNRFTITGIMGKEQKCSIVVFLTASKTEEHSITGGKEETLSEALGKIEIPNHQTKDEIPTSSFYSSRKGKSNKPLEKGMPTPSGASETKKLSGQMAQMSNSLSSNDKMMTSSSSSQLSPKKISDSKPNAMNKVISAGNIMHQGNNNTNNYNAQQQKQADQQQLQAKKRSQQQEQKSYNQHWLIQEAEQRRLAGGSTKPQRVSPSMNQQINNQMNMNQNYQQNNGHHLNNMMMTSPISQGGDMPPSPNHINTQSPVYENSSYVNHQQHNVHQHNMYTNHQRIPPQPTNDNNWQQHNGVQNGMGYNDQSPQQQHNTNLNQQYPMPNENVYANLGSQPPLGPNMHHQDNSSLNYEREGLIPGPQVPPRNPQETSPGSHGDRVLSVSGKKRCSHCKEELGRGAAMIIESLRLFYHLRCFQCCVCQVQLGNGASATDVRVRNNKLHCQNCYSNDEGLKFSKV